MQFSATFKWTDFKKQEFMIFEHPIQSYVPISSNAEHCHNFSVISNELRRISIQFSINFKIISKKNFVVHKNSRLSLFFMLKQLWPRKRDFQISVCSVETQTRGSVERFSSPSSRNVKWPSWGAHKIGRIDIPGIGKCQEQADSYKLYFSFLFFLLSLACGCTRSVYISRPNPRRRKQVIRNWRSWLVSRYCVWSSQKLTYVTISLSLSASLL